MANKKLVSVLSTAALTALISSAVATTAFAKIDGIVAKDAEGNYLNYDYEALKESLKNDVLGKDGAELYNAFTTGDVVSFHDDKVGFVDAEVVKKAAKDAALAKEAFDVNAFTESAEEAVLPGTVYAAKVEGGKVVKGTEVKPTTVVAAELKVESVTAVTNSKVNVVLTDAVETVSADQFVVTDKDGKAVEVKSATLSLDGKTVTLTTVDMVTGAKYTLTVNEIAKTFVANVPDAVAPQLTSAVATGNTKVKLTFSESVDESALAISSYKIDGLTVLKAEYELDAYAKPIKTNIILTTGSQTSGTIYKVEVTNVTDLAGNVINTLFDEFQFGGLPVDAIKPQLTSTVALTNTSVKVTFNEAVDKATAENIANYSVSGLTVLKAALSVDGTYVTLTTSPQTLGSIYKVIVTNVTDTTGNVIDADYDEFQFGGLAVDTVKPQLTSAVALTTTSVKVTFNEAVDKATAENIANYSIAGLTVLKAVLSTDATYVTLTTSAQTLGTIYKTVVTNVTDLAGNVINSDYDEFQFGGLAADSTKPTVVGVAPVNATSVKVTFSEPISDATGALAYNYYFGTELGYATKAVKDTVTTDGSVWVLTTAQQSKKVYTLDVTGVEDLSGNVLNEDYDTATFAGNSVGDTTAPKVASAVAIDKNTVVVTFNEEMDASTIAAADFTFAVSSGTEATQTAPATVLAGATADAINVGLDKKTVTLQFANAVQTAGVVYKVTVATVNDASSNPIDATYNYALFAGTSAVNPAPKVSSAILLDNQTLKVNFTEPVSVVGGVGVLAGSDFTITPGSGASAFTGVFNKAILSADGTSLTVYYKNQGTPAATDKFEAGKLYTVTVNAAKVKDKLEVAALSTAVATDNQGVFAGISTGSATPKIASIVAIDKNTIDITFNQKVNSTLASSVVGDLTVVNNATGASFAAVDALIRAEGLEGNKLRVFFDNSTPFVAGSVYKVTLDNTKITNENGYAMVAADNNAVFAAISTVNPAPSIASVQVVDTTHIKVVMSEKVDTTTAEDATVDFAIAGNTITVAALDATDGKTITLTLGTPLTAGISTITVDASANLKDEAGVATIDTTSKYTFAN